MCSLLLWETVFFHSYRNFENIFPCKAVCNTSWERSCAFSDTKGEKLNQSELCCSQRKISTDSLFNETRGLRWKRPVINKIPLKHFKERNMSRSKTSVSFQIEKLFEDKHQTKPKSMLRNFCFQSVLLKKKIPKIKNPLGDHFKSPWSH